MQYLKMVCMYTHPLTLILTSCYCVYKIGYYYTDHEELTILSVYHNFIICNNPINPTACQSLVQ